jgi:hypothetical protein
MKITNKTQLQGKLDKIAVEALEDLAVKVKELWQDLIDKRFYQQYSPKIYKRTYQLYSSVVVTEVAKVGNKWALNVLMDTDTVAREYATEPPEVVWELAAEGIHGTPEIQTSGRFYTEILAILEDGELVREFEGKLRSMGLKLTWKHS